MYKLVYGYFSKITAQILTMNNIRYTEPMVSVTMIIYYYILYCILLNYRKRLKRNTMPRPKSVKMIKTTKHSIEVVIDENNQLIVNLVKTSNT